MSLPLAKLPPKTKQLALNVEVVKQHPGLVQVTRRVQVQVPGKHFPQLEPAEQAAFYLGTAVEYKDRHNFPRHLKAWGAPHTGPGIRFLCNSDAIDDPDNRGHWFLLTPVPARTLKQVFACNSTPCSE